MSDNEEPNYGFYGKPLEQFDEDSVPKKRLITVEEQIATDNKGRRRFHGAFTGGFSAGFFNTVGSLEGWRPSEFKSSRSEKAANKLQKPEDYMDDEDVGEFGIAPQTVKATDNYNTSKKRKKKHISEGPIPGEPVLQTLIESGNETIGYLLLRHLGYKHGDDEEEPEEEPTGKVYGCEMPKTRQIKKTLETITCNIPEIYKKAIAMPKMNTFGMGYVGLDKSNVNLFTSSNLVVRERNNKKLSIGGQAFGVGAFEEDDEDIYAKEDLSKYDFELTSEKTQIKKKEINKLKFDLFLPSKNLLASFEVFPLPTIPHSFSGKHKVKKSRFEPVVEEVVQRKDIDANVRAKYLGENAEKEFTPSNQQHKTPKSVSLSNQTKNMGENKTGEQKEVSKEQKPIKQEFSLAGGSGLIFDRFVSATKKEDLDILQPVERSISEHGTADQREAARMKMYGQLTRISNDWSPHTIVCRRFNVPETHLSENELKPKKKSINLIFENETYVSEPANFIKPGLNQSGENLIAAQEVITATTSQIEENLSEQPPSLPQEEEEEKETNLPPAIIDHTEKLDISKNIDLFKAIFMDSDEEEEVEEEKEAPKETPYIIETKDKEEEAREEEIKTQLLSADMLLPKIKPLKEGILSNVDFSVFTPVAPTKPESPKPSSTSKEEPNLYGPKLPEKIIFQKPVKVADVRSDDEWIEKDDLSNNDKKKVHKHKRKNKKVKHKKKHKHRR